MKEITIEQDGWFTLAIANEDGPPTPHEIDTLRAYHSYIALCAQHADETARADAWVEYLVNNGIPKLSHAAAFRVAEAIIAEVKSWPETERWTKAAADARGA